MASKDRIQRSKEETRNKILHAALQIVKEEGWQSLSLRKIADVIEYTAPIIYEYFANKEAILLELTRQGYLILNKEIREARDQHKTPARQIEAMWMAYWNFAFAEKEYYQLMFGVEMICCGQKKSLPEYEAFPDMISDAIVQVMGDKHPDEDEVCRRYYTYWSVVHGLISINIVRKGSTDEINRQILTDAISGITMAIAG
jgi:AcrR family transcriptional regulator